MLCVSASFPCKGYLLYVSFPRFISPVSLRSPRNNSLYSPLAMVVRRALGLTPLPCLSLTHSLVPAVCQASRSLLSFIKLPYLAFLISSFFPTSSARRFLFLSFFLFIFSFFLFFFLHLHPFSALLISFSFHLHPWTALHFFSFFSPLSLLCSSYFSFLSYLPLYLCSGLLISLFFLLIFILALRF